MKVITKQWLEFAKADLRNCEHIIKDKSLTNIIAFHSQQAVEKCFKAVIEEKAIKIKRIHSLVKLYEIVAKYINFPVDEEFLSILDSIYTSSRYPGDTGLLPDGQPNIEEAVEMYEFATQIYNKIINILEETKF